MNTINISNYKYVHLMFNDKFNKPFVDFVNRNFNKKEHIFLCHKWFDEFPMPEDDNVISHWSYTTIDLSSERISKIICHSLFGSPIIDYLYRNPKILKEKAYWMIWGSDLYNAKRDTINDYVRANFKGYISGTDGDCEIAKEKYKSNPETYNAVYTVPITINMINSTKRIDHDYIQIQINNSADISTLSMLDILSKYKNNNIKIRTILSYGQMMYKDEIIKKGKELFGDRFSWINDYLQPEDYAKELAENDILILNQNRQQGMGNCFSSLALGTKVFIRNDVTSYNHFNSKDIKVFDTNLIEKMDFNDFVSYDKKLKSSNQKKSMIFFDDNYLKELWSKVFCE